ncbi:putative outer membrane protein [Algoriphagus machipongonensis]|uniref:Outer membrane protein n=2 Tax=Algoriphagus machipongonensis TaxID=388413 RepID=A3I1P5_9BACT|nr:putative outer membrane protein [Algoriphagus machipongonensis]
MIGFVKQITLKEMKMKKISILSVFAILTFATSCVEELTKQPDFISENQVFEDPNLTNSYVANLYQRIGFQRGVNVSMATKNAVGGENIGFAPWQEPNGTSTRQFTEVTGPGALDEWDYNVVRDMNYLLENITESETLDEQFVEEKISEVKFLRAFEYFEMVKRFGGVPLVLEVQSADQPEEELYVSRNSEEEVYDFIYSETQEILANFDDSKTGAGGKVDKYTVLMLQSRAMLYAASIAKYGDGSSNGVVGIPSGRAAEFFQKSYDASKQIIDSGMFRLINDGEDKVANYASIFVNDGNDETIFAEVFEPFLKGHDWDHLAIPAGFNATWNSNFPVLYEMVELFDFTDGRSGMIDRSLFTNSTEWDINDFFGNRDPRFRAAVFYQGTPFQGKKVYFHSATIYDDNGTMKESTSEGQTFTTIDGESFPGAAPRRNRVNTGLLLRKRVDDNALTPQYGSSGQDFIVYRYAETLLNYAEAAMELAKASEAMDAINQIRDRVSMPLFESITLEDIRHERQVELCFEEHRYFDLVRWRLAEEKLSLRTQGIILKYNLETDKYVITLKNAENQIRVFEPNRYYLPFGINRLADNSNLVQNPGY